MHRYEKRNKIKVRVERQQWKKTNRQKERVKEGKLKGNFVCSRERAFYVVVWCSTLCVCVEERERERERESFVFALKVRDTDIERVCKKC